MPKKFPERPSTARRAAWAISSDINVVAIYRLATAAMFTILLGMVGWLGSGLISGQSEIARQVAVGNSQLANEAGLVDAANHRIDMLATRINENDRRVTVLETQMNDGKRR